MTELLSITALVFSAIALLHTLSSSAGERVAKTIESCFDTLSALIAAEYEIADLNRRLKAEIKNSSGIQFAKNSGILASLDVYEERLRNAREGLVAMSESKSYVTWFFLGRIRVAHFKGTVSTGIAQMLHDAKYAAEHYPGIREQALQLEAMMNATYKLDRDPKNTKKHLPSEKPQSSHH